MAYSRLRLTLRTNATTCLIAGLVATFAPGWLSDTLGFDHVALTLAGGLGFVTFAAFIFYFSRNDDDLVWLSALVSVADFSWVVLSAIAVVSGVLTTTGNIVGIAQGVMVADFAAMQLWYRNQIVGHHTATLAV